MTSALNFDNIIINIMISLPKECTSRKGPFDLTYPHRKYSKGVKLHERGCQFTGPFLEIILSPNVSCSNSTVCPAVWQACVIVLLKPFNFFSINNLIMQRQCNSLRTIFDCRNLEWLPKRACENWTSRLLSISTSRGGHIPEILYKF